MSATRSREIILFVLAPLIYVIAWLFVLPGLAEVSTPAAVLSLSVLSGIICTAIAWKKGRNGVAWGLVGALAGFFELGILAIIGIVMIRRKPAAA